MTEQITLTQHRERLARVLCAVSFQSSKQARDFLHPTTDASVRKLATYVRQRPGLSTGIYVQGAGGRLRLVRYHGESPSISLVFDGQRAPDFPGSPPVCLRPRANRDDIGGEFSVDARSWRRVSTPVPVVASRRQGASGPVPPMRFFYAQEDLFPSEAIHFRNWA
jgi:hypothetical protein